MRIRGRQFACFPLLLAMGLLCLPHAQPSSPRREVRVLFIGNSLTYSNDLPAIVQALASSRRLRFVHRSVVFPNFSLQDHWEKGAAQKAIAAGGWDVVVLQQGPSGLEESRRLLIDYTRRLDREIRAAGATPALFMVWPSRARFRDFDRVVESYRLAAAEVNGVLLPVGAAWQEAWKLDSQLPLYADDQFHPSPAGSYLAALVIFQKLLEASPEGLPASLRLRSKSSPRTEIPPGQARQLQAAASEANKKF